MKAFILVFLLTFVVGLALCDGANAGDPVQSLLIRQRRDTEIFDNSKKLVEALIQSLQGSARQSIDALTVFGKGVQDQVPLFQKKFLAEIDKVRLRIRQAIKNITGRVLSNGAAVAAGAIECVTTYSDEAEALVDATVAKTISCADGRINEIGGLISSLAVRAQAAAQTAEDALNKLRNCTGNGIISSGSCIASVTFDTEIKAATFLAQNGISMARINLAVTTLPAALEVCAASRLVEAGLSTAKITADIGRCSATSAFSTLTGGDVPASNVEDFSR